MIHTGIISDMRVKNKNAPYAHEPKPEIEKFANQTIWLPDTLLDLEQQVPSTSALPATTPQVLKEKRPRQESSPPVTEVSSEEFQIHSKKAEDSLNAWHNSRSHHSDYHSDHHWGQAIHFTFRLESA
jgi:hypothetical protein